MSENNKAIDKRCHAIGHWKTLELVNEWNNLKG